MLTINQCVYQLRNSYDVVIELECNYSDIESAKVDLYTKLKKIYQESYNNNQRLIFVLTQDLYNKNSPCGSVLHAIQVIVQDIDISNFFICIVTTNSDADTEYQYIVDSIDIGSVGMTIYKCSGNFTKKFSEHKTVEGKIHSLKNIDFDLLTDKQKNLLFSSPVFCIIPWVGINIDTTSKVYPCCEFKKSDFMGNVTTQPIGEIWNSHKFKSLRQAMLNEQSLSACQSCYIKEQVKQNSLRNNFNRDFAHHIHLIDKTHHDGHLPDVDIKHWDIRYNNLCNLSCRSCNPTSSSSLQQVYKKIYPEKQLSSTMLQVGNNQDSVFEQVVKNIHNVEIIYFAGGEPSMIENFYKILELLIAKNRFDVQLRYNINMSRLALKEKSLPKLWNKFKHVSVGASLDGEHQRAEYLRVGTIWSDVIKNRLILQEQCPHVDFWISSTTGLINALHVPDFHRSWIEQNLINAADFNVQLLLSPEYQSVLNAPQLLKEKIIKKYISHLEWLRPLDKTGRATYGFNSIIELCQLQGDYNPDKFWSEVGKLDQYHGTDLLNVFPELQNSGL
jgi:radical SAM protein with 4Fe4S-binding SPASM domain